MSYPGSFDYDFIASLQALFKGGNLPAEYPTAPSPEEWRAFDADCQRAGEVSAKLRQFITFETSAILAELGRETQARQQLQNEVNNLHSQIATLETMYLDLVKQNEKFMKACVCVTLATEPNTPELVK